MKNALTQEQRTFIGEVVTKLMWGKDHYDKDRAKAIVDSLVRTEAFESMEASMDLYSRASMELLKLYNDAHPDLPPEVMQDAAIVCAWAAQRIKLAGWLADRSLWDTLKRLLDAEDENDKAWSKVGKLFGLSGSRARQVMITEITDLREDNVRLKGQVQDLTKKMKAATKAGFIDVVDDAKAPE